MSEISDDNRINDASPLTRSVATASLVAAAFGMPSLWKNLEKHFPAGLGGSLSSISTKTSMTEAEKMFVLARAAVEQNKNPSVISEQAQTAIEKREFKNTEISKQQTLDRNAYDQYDVKEKLHRENRNTLNAFKTDISKQSLIERVKYLDKEITGKGTIGFDRLKSIDLKKAAIMRIWEEHHNEAQFAALFPELKATGIDIRSAKKIPLRAYELAFDACMERGNNNSKIVAAVYLNVAVKNSPGHILRMGPNDKPVTVGHMRNQFLKLNKHSVINFDGALGILNEEKKIPLFDKPKLFTLSAKDRVDDIMSSVKTNFKHLNDVKIYGNTVQNLNNLVKDIQTEIQSLSKLGQTTKNFNIIVDHRNNRLTLSSATHTGSKIIKNELHLALPSAQRRISHSTSSNLIDISSYIQNGQSITVGSAFEKTSYELSKLARSFVHGIHLEKGAGEVERIQSLINRVYQTELPSGSVLLDAFKQSKIRSDDPRIFEKKHKRHRRNVGFTQHTLVTAAKRSGQDFVTYDQEFIAGRAGPNLIGAHEATPYELSYTRTSGQGRITVDKTIWIKTERMKRIINEHKGTKSSVEYTDFIKSLESIGKSSPADVANILNEIDSKGIPAKKAYEQFAKDITGANLVDHNGRYGPDWAIMDFYGGSNVRAGVLNTFDTLDMFKAAGTNKFGWGKNALFLERVSNPNVDFTPFESRLLNSQNKSSNVIKLINDYKNRIARDPHNKRAILIELLIGESHGAAIDVIMQDGLLQDLINSKPLLGSRGSNIANMSDLLMDTSIDLNERFRIINSNLAYRHFGGKIDGLNNMDPTTRGSRMISEGTYSGISAYSLDLFQAGNTGLKQTYQLFQAFHINVPDSDRAGRFTDPIVTAWRQSIDSYGKKAIGNNIAINAEPVMVKVALLPQGYGFLTDDVILGEQSMLSRMTGEMESETMKILLGKNGEITDPRMRNWLLKIKNQSKQKFSPNFIQDKKFIEEVQRYIGRENDEVSKAMRAGLLESGSTKFHPWEKDSIIGRTLMGQTKQAIGGNVRISAFNTIVNEQGLVELVLKTKKLVGMEKADLVGVKALVKGIPSLDEFQRGWEVSAGLIHKYTKVSFIAAQSFLKREEIGTAKKSLLLRAYGQMMDNQHSQKAKNFIDQCFSNVHSLKADVGNRIVIQTNTVAQTLEAYNSITMDKLYRGTVDAGLIWNRKDIGLMKEFYNIQYKTDLEGFRAFDQKVLDIYKKANPSQRIAEGANITSTLDGMMKNEHVKFLRTYVNPFYHPEKGFVNPDVTPTARMVDPLEVDVDGKRMVVPGLETWATPHTLVPQHQQVVGHVAKWIKGGIHNDPFLHMRNAMFKGSIEERLLERTAGTYKHKLRNSMLKYLGGLKGVSALTEGAVRIDGGLDVLLQRTLTNEAIMKDVELGLLKPEKINADKFKEYQRSAWNTVTTEEFEKEASRLKTMAEEGVATNRKELLKQAEILEAKAKNYRTKPLHDFGNTITYEDVSKTADTVYGDMKRSPMTGEFSSSSSVNIGKAKVSPYDIILLKTKGFSNVGNVELWDEVMDNAMKAKEAMGVPSATASKTRDRITKLLNEMGQFMKNNKMSDVTALPSFQMILELSNMDPEDVYKPFAQRSLVKSYSGLVTALNERDNAGAFDDFVRKKYVKFHSELLETISGKRRGNGFSLLYSEGQHMFTGLYGQLDSISQADEVLKHNINNLGKNTHALGKGEMSIREQLDIAKKMRSGQYGMMSREVFAKHTVGDMPVIPFLEKILGKERTQKILQGSEAIPLKAIAYPLDTNELKLGGNLEVYLHDSNNRVFKDLPKGFVAPWQVMEELGRDMDGDHGATALLNVTSAAEYDELVKHTRKSNLRRAHLMTEFQDRALKTGNFKTALNETMQKYAGKELEGVAVTKTEIYHASKISQKMFEKGKIQEYLKKEKMFGVRNITTEEAHKFTIEGNIGATDRALKKLVSPILEGEFISDRLAKARLQTYSAVGVGIMSDFATRNTTKLAMLGKYLGGVQLDKTMIDKLRDHGLFSGVDVTDVNAVRERFAMITDDVNVSLLQQMDEIGEALRGPEQALISAKKMNVEDAARYVKEAIDNPSILLNPDPKYNVHRQILNVNLTERQITQHNLAIGLVDTISKHNSVFNEELQTGLSYLKSSGVDLGDVNARIAHDFISKNFGNMPSKMLEDLAPGVMDEMTSKFAQKTAKGWRNSVKQLMFTNKGKTAIGMGVALSLITGLNPNQMSGGVMDFGIDLGHRPGSFTESNVGYESLTPEPGQDVFEKKWTYLLKNDPLLKDNMSKLEGKTYKGFNLNDKAYGQFKPKKTYKMNYIDHRKSYNKRYETNDMRRVKMI